MFDFTFSHVMDLSYEIDGHRHINIPVFFESGNNSNDTVDFILDTGAYLTVITQDTAYRMGYNNIKPLARNVTLTGYAGHKIEGDMVEIPMLIAGKRIDYAKVAIPYVPTDSDILGLNVLEHFNYMIDSENNKMYFSHNPTYRAREELRCRNIWLVSDFEANHDFLRT